MQNEYNSKIIVALDIIINEIDNLRVTSLNNSYIWDEQDLKEELLRIRDMVEEI